MLNKYDEFWYAISIPQGNLSLVALEPKHRKFKMCSNLIDIDGQKIRFEDFPYFQ